jgi:hypothetical protein
MLLLATQPFSTMLCSFRFTEPNFPGKLFPKKLLLFVAFCKTTPVQTIGTVVKF